MMNFCSCSTRKTHARVVRRNNTPCLLASFDTSTPPMLWQFDLEKMSNYTIMLREKDGEWDLGIALPQGTFAVVAHFDDRGDAETAYTSVRSALLAGERPAYHPLRWGAALILILAAYFFLSSSGANKEHEMAQTATQMNTTTAAPAEDQRLAPGEIPSGVPVPADQVLQPPAD